MSDVTRILSQIDQGDPAASEQLLPLVYEELRKLAAARLAKEKPGQTLQPTALVHEAFVRLVDAENAQKWNNRAHFFGAAAEAMRRILVEQARRKASGKGGGHLNRVELGDLEAPEVGSSLELIALSEAIDAFEAIDPRAAQVVKLRFFAGLARQQVAEALGMSPATIDNDWAYAKSWLRTELSADDAGAS